MNIDSGAMRLTTLIEIITSYDVAIESENNAFQGLIREAVGFGNSDSFFAYLASGEGDYMHHFHGDNPDAVKKNNGTWKYSKYLPKAYQSSKSVLGKALDNGIGLTNPNGEFKGKSQLEREYKDKTKTNPVEQTPDERARAYVSKLKNVWPNVSDEVMIDIKDTLYVLFNREM